MNTLFTKKRINYDGSQLSPHWILRNFKLLGDSIIAFRGGCSVREHMVDVVDVINKDFIYSSDMIHFIIEHFRRDLDFAVHRQWILAGIIKDVINDKPSPLVGEDAPSEKATRVRVVRVGSDLYVGDRKLSVSVATVSPVSSLIHFGINVISKGTPVKTIGFEDLKINPDVFAKRIIEQYAREDKRISNAGCKVRPV